MTHTDTIKSTIEDCLHFIGYENVQWEVVPEPEGQFGVRFWMEHEDRPNTEVFLVFDKSADQVLAHELRTVTWHAVAAILGVEDQRG